MMSLRRILAVLLAVIFITGLMPALVLSRLNDTLGSPGFYARQLRQADVYNFIHDGILPAAIDQAGAGPNIAWAKPQILGVARETVPPDWLQAQTEKVLFEVVPYVTGDTDAFKVNIPLKDRVIAAAASVKSTLRQGNTMDIVYDLAIKSAVSPAVTSTDMPLLSPAVIQDMLHQVFPPDWVRQQIDAAIDVTLPYFMMDQEHFSLRINLADRLDALQPIMIDRLRKPEAYDYLTGQVFSEALKQASQTPLPLGITLSGDEITSLMKQAFPLEWYQARVPELVGQVFAYLRGTKPALELDISIADRKPVISQAAAGLIDRKLEAWYNSLPVAPITQIPDLLRSLASGNLPAARPPLVTYAMLKAALSAANVDLTAMVTSGLNAVIPDRFGFADAGTTAALSPLRDFIQKGYVYTDQDLTRQLGAGGSLLSHALRQTIATGFTFTEGDLRNLVGPGRLDTLDGVRANIGTARRLRWLAWAILAMVLVAIGALAGRRWATGLYAAGGALAGAAIVALIVFGPVFSAAVQSRVTAGLAQMAGHPDKLNALVATKMSAIAQSSLDAFIGGLRGQSVIILVVALLVIGIGVFLDVRKRRAGA